MNQVFVTCREVECGWWRVVVNNGQPHAIAEFECNVDDVAARSAEVLDGLLPGRLRVVQ